MQAGVDEPSDGTYKYGKRHGSSTISRDVRGRCQCSGWKSPPIWKSPLLPYLIRLLGDLRLSSHLADR